MKKFLLIGLVLCAMFTNKVSAQNDWVTMSFQLENRNEYTFKMVKFFPNSVTSLHDTGESLIIGGKKDGSAGVFYRSTSGWSTEENFPAKANNVIRYMVNEGGYATNVDHPFESLTGMTTTQMITYVYGINGTLMKKQNSSWLPVTVPGTENVDFIGAAFTPDGNIGVVTDGTKIYFTPDQGESWMDAQLPTGSTSKINSIIFHSINDDVSTFFAVGENGLVLKSVTSGYSWNVVSGIDLDGATIDFTSIVFIDENTAYIAGVGIDGNDMKAGIWTGTGMNTASVDVFRSPSAASFTSGAIRDFMGAEEEFYAMTAKGEIITTKDGGVKWESLRAAEVTNPVVSYFISPCRVLYALRENGDMEALIPELAATIVPEQTTTLNKYRFYAKDLRGYIGKIRWEYDNAYPSATNNALVSPIIQFNRNGKQEVRFIISGRIPGGEEQEKVITIEVDPETNFDWEHILVSPADLNPSRPHYGVINTGVHFPEGQNQIGYMSTQLFTTGDEGFVWKTEDGGETWNCILKSDKSKGINVEGLYSVSFPTLNVGYACGWRNVDESQSGAARWGDFQLWKTKDAGATWELLDVASELIYAPGFNTSNDQHFLNVVFMDDKRGIVHSGMATLYTEDGGETWHGSNFNLRYPLDLPPSAIHEVCHAEGDILYGAGNGGELYRSTDAGKTWGYVNASRLGTALSLDFYDENLGIQGLIGGDGSCIAITRDGGMSWEAIKIEGITEVFITAVKFASRDVIYAGGACMEGTVLHKSTDGGRTWKQESYPSIGESVYDIFVTPTGVVHAACTDGVGKYYIPDMDAKFSYTTDGDIVSFINESVGYITNYTWKIDGEVKSTEASLIITLPEGQYSIELTVSGADPRTGVLETKTITRSVNLELSGVDLNQVAATVSVYPNPVGDYLYVTFNAPEAASAKVIVANLLGQVVSTTEYTHPLVDSHYSIDASGWSKGAYTVTFVIAGKPTKTVKVIK